MSDLWIASLGAFYLFLAQFYLTWILWQLGFKHATWFLMAKDIGAALLSAFAGFSLLHVAGVV